MITSLRLVDFKNFADETLHLGPFTLIVGANASGKSNIRDAFRFLNGVGYGYTLAEIVGGKYGADWQPIRGAANEIIRFGQAEFAFEVEVKSTESSKSDAEVTRYFLRIGRDDQDSGRFRVTSESMVIDSKNHDSPVSGIVYTTAFPFHTGAPPPQEDSRLRLYLPGVDDPVEVSSDKPGLNQDISPTIALVGDRRTNDFGDEQPGDYVERLQADIRTLRFGLRLAIMRFLELSPERMRMPSLSGAAGLGDFGDNLPTVLEAICTDHKRKAVLLSWLHELTPMDVSDLTFPRDPSGRIHLQVQEANGKSVSAYSASDGTLRFLGMLAALLNEDFKGLYFIEEIDNGIHPARLHLLLDLIERQTAKGKIQVVATTHSPDVLNLINDTTFENTSVIYRDEDSADAVIRRVAELPNARELRKSQGLGRLHTAGWMENILSFAEAEREDEKGGE